MFHSGTQKLIDVWSTLPDARRIPMRAALDPVGLGRLLPQTFLADRGERNMPLRLAGGWVESLHGGALKGADWLSLWRAESRPLVEASMVQAYREARPVVMAAGAGGLVATIEIVIAPMRGPDGHADRLLGLYQWTDAADRTAEDVGPLAARMAIGVGPVGRAPLTLAAIDGRRIA